MSQQPFIGQNQAGEVKTEWPTPDPVDEILVALLESKIQDYVALVMGTPPPQGSHPEQLLCQQIPVDWSHVQRTYAKDRTAQQTYNYSISYDEEGNAFPIFTRDYIVRRYGYVPLTKGTALAGLMSAVVTAGGTGYVQETVNDIVSSGATVRPVISNGVVVHLAILAEGNATSTSTGVGITGTTGSGGVASLLVQPQSAVLVKEDFLRTPDSPLDGLWCLVRRVYATLPGDTLTNVSYDPKTNTFTTTSKTRKLTSAITPSAGIVTIGSDVYVQEITRQPIDDLTSYEVVKLQPAPASKDLDTAVQTTRYAPFQFPAILDAALYSSTGGVLGYTPAFTRTVKHQIYTYFVVSDTEPDITDIMEDLTNDGGIPILGAIFGVLRNGGNLFIGTLSEIIYNSVALTYNGTTIDWPGSTPDLDTYRLDWVGTARAVMGRVSGVDNNYFFWEVEITKVMFLIEPGGTIEP